MNLTKILVKNITMFTFMIFFLNCGDIFLCEHRKTKIDLNDIVFTSAFSIF